MSTSKAVGKAQEDVASGGRKQCYKGKVKEQAVQEAERTQAGMSDCNELFLLTVDSRLQHMYYIATSLAVVSALAHCRGAARPTFQVGRDAYGVSETAHGPCDLVDVPKAL